MPRAGKCQGLEETMLWVRAWVGPSVRSSPCVPSVSLIPAALTLNGLQESVVDSVSRADISFTHFHVEYSQFQRK